MIKQINVPSHLLLGVTTAEMHNTLHFASTSEIRNGACGYPLNHRELPYAPWLQLTEAQTPGNRIFETSHTAVSLSNADPPTVKCSERVGEVKMSFSSSWLFCFLSIRLVNEVDTDGLFGDVAREPIP